MIIRQIQALNLRIPLSKPVQNPAYIVSESLYTLVSIISDEGIQGWSFVYGVPMVKTFVQDLAPLLIGEEIDIRRLWQKISASRSVRFDRGGIAMRALSAIDIALWDLVGKAASMPIHRLLGTFRSEVPVYYSGGLYPERYDRKSELFECLRQDLSIGLEKGFRAFKVKMGRETPATDLERIAYCRELIGPDCQLMIDCFCTYDAPTIIRLARQLEQYDIAFLEEPVTLDDIAAYAQVASSISIPVAMGESHYTMMQFRDIIRQKAAAILQNDPAYVGGISAFVQYAGVVAFLGLKLVPHGSHDLNVQLGMALPEIVQMEYMDLQSQSFQIQRILQNPVVAHQGVICAPEGPGHGLILNERAVQKYRE